ncbi:MAG: 2-oxoacid:acceptor oxidoreductase subunit alpha, partial [Desulfobacteraceae bacterium]
SPLVFSQESGTLLCGWGSTQGSIIEAGQVLRGMGHDVGWLIFKDLWPLDWEKVTALAGDKKLIMVEQNATGQLGSLITGQTGIFPAGRVLKYDGRPMGPRFIVQTITTMMEQ